LLTISEIKDDDPKDTRRDLFGGPRIIPLIRALLENAPPRHWATYDTVKRRLEELDIEDATFFEELEMWRWSALGERREKSASQGPTLERWVRS
jgi:hypothetical protein